MDVLEAVDLPTFLEIAEDGRKAAKGRGTVRQATEADIRRLLL